MSKLQNSIFALVTTSPDYVNTEIILDKKEALEKYDEELKSLEDYDGICLLQIDGSGSIYVGQEFDGNENIRILKDSNYDD